MTRRGIVFQHLVRLRRDYLRSRTVLFSLAMLSACLCLLLLFVLADLAFQMPTLGCWLLWLVLLGIIGAGVWVVRQNMRQKVSNSAMAVLVERVLPHLDNHLINSVQFAEHMANSGPFVEEVLSEVELDLDQVEYRHLYSQKPMQWIRRSLGGMTVVLAVLCLITPRGVGHAALRLLLPMAGVDPYSLTRLASVSPGNTTVQRGNSVTVTVAFAGVEPKNPCVIWERGRGKTDRIQLAPNAEAGPDTKHLRMGELKNVFYDSQYRVVGGDVKSPWYALSVANPPGLETWKAKIIPPEYTGLEESNVDNRDTNQGVPGGSDIVFGGVASCALNSISLVQDERFLGDRKTVGRRKFAIKFQVRDGGPVRLHMTAENGLETTASLPFVIVPDQKPTVLFLDTKQRIVASQDAQVPVGFQAEDDYGVTAVGLERLVGENAAEQAGVAAPDAVANTFSGRFVIDLASFLPREGDALRFRIWAEDNGPNAAERRGYSAVVQVSIPDLQEQRSAKKEVVAQAKDSILTIVKLQRENLKNTRHLADLAVMKKPVTSARIQDTQVAQKSIRDMSVQLLKERAALGDLANVLSGLVNHEMTEVLEVFEEAHRVEPEGLPDKLHRCVALETQILAALTGIPSNLAREQIHQEKTDLFASLQKLVAGQRKNLRDSKAQERDAAGAPGIPQLAQTEDALANDLINFSDHCLVLIEERVDDEFAGQIRKVYDLIEAQEAYEKMLNAAEYLETGDMAAAIQSQEEALRTLLQALDILNVWRMKNAEKIVRDAAEVLKETAEKLGELEAKQANIAEVTRELAARGKLDDEVRDKLREMDEEQKDMADMLEKMAQDLYQFPELPVCNELNSKMREIFEDVEQAMDSENMPAIEIAVQKEDSLLDAIRKTKERVEDVEMWLMDIPDNIVWNMESFDTDEFPDIPLVPLPDELEDIVGELLDQASDIDAQSQDTTGNNIIADMEMGWGIMDGPMPSFAAKGKSGNARPNDNEMTGRSGAGREGQSTGELVENHVKGLEGRKTHARRTRDPFQKGMVTEDEDSTLDAKSTGGGKLGGESEAIGMFGKAPRRDLHTAAHGTAPTQLRQDAEALYATARLLYLGTGSLGMAARELRGIEDAPHRMRKFGSLHRRVLRRLEDTQVELSSGVVLPMPVASVSQTGGAVTDEVDINDIAEEYRDIVSDYYRSLAKE